MDPATDPKNVDDMSNAQNQQGDASSRTEASGQAQGATPAMAGATSAMSGAPAPTLDEGSAFGPKGNAPGVQPAAAAAPAPPKKMGTFESIFQALAGGPKTEYHPDAQGNIVKTETPLTKGRIAAGILAGVLTGLGAGYGETGPNAAGRAFSKGMGTVMGQQQDIENKKRATAEQDFKNQQQQLMTQAQIAHLNVMSLAARREIAQKDIDYLDKYNTQEEAFKKTVLDSGGQVVPITVGGKSINGVPGNSVALRDWFTKNPTPPDGMAYIHHFTVDTVGLSKNEKGQWVDENNQPVDIQKRTTDTVVSVPVNQMKTPQTMTNAQIEAETGVKMPGDPNKQQQITLEQLTSMKSSQSKSALEAAQAKKAAAEAAGEPAKAEEARAKAGLAEEQTKQLQMGGAYLAQPDSVGFTAQVGPGGVKEYTKKEDAFIKSQQMTKLQGLRAAKQSFDDIVNRMEAGNYTGADSVAGLFDAVGISVTPLQGKGMRVNNDTIRHHVDTRGLDQRAIAAANNLKKGQIITPQQLRDYANLANGIYVDSYINAVNDAHAQGLKADFILPRGNGQQISAPDAQVFLKLSGDNVDKARQSATALGWKF